MLSLRPLCVVVMLLATASLVPAPASASGEVVVFADDFELGSPGWSATGLWELSSQGYASPGHAWHYGVERSNGTRTYDTPGWANAGELVSPPIDLTGLSRAKASFWTRWEGEGTCSYEHPLLFAERAGGARIAVWESCLREGEGGYEANLTAFVGETIRLVFRWDTVDSFANDFDGWTVDDVVVREEDAASVQPAADLVAAGLFLLPTPRAGEAVNVSATFENRGAIAAAGNVTVALFLDGAPVGTPQTFPSGLPGGASRHVGATVRMPHAGPHVLELRVDVDQNVSESNEANNVLSKPFDVAPTQMDLSIASLGVMEPIYAGREGWANATLRVTSHATREPFTIAWTLDGAPLASRSFPPGVRTGLSNLTQPLPALDLGEHTLTLVLDAADDIIEASEENNTRTITFLVVPLPQVGLEVLSLRPVPVTTDAGDAPHPLGRHEASVRACNAAPTASARGDLRLELRGRDGATMQGAGNVTLPGRPLAAIAGGACLVERVVFDAPGVVGDFTFVVTARISNDGNASDDTASANGSRLVEGHGGAVLPVGGQAPSGPGGSAWENATSVIAGVGASLEDAQEAPFTFALDQAEELVCVTSTSEACRATRGDAGFANVLRPCTPQEPPAIQSLTRFVTWYAVHAYEERALFRPESRPLSQDWPLPYTPLPIPGEAPALCRNLWDDAHGLAGEGS